jgi:hypothetical protein
MQRMTLAYLIGSEGHFGQPRRRASSNGYNEYDDSAIIVTESEVSALLGLLADSLQQRAKAGAGGYSAATFNVKWVLYSIRCLVTNTLNQIQIVNVVGVRLNVLLLKVLALHALRNSTVIDAEAAEYAAFTLYLLSNRGFKVRLPLFSITILKLLVPHTPESFSGTVPSRFIWCRG